MSRYAHNPETIGERDPHCHDCGTIPSRMTTLYLGYEVELTEHSPDRWLCQECARYERYMEG